MIVQEANAVEQILMECKRRGITIFIEDGKLAYKPQARMTRGLLYDIQQNKIGMLSLLEVVASEQPALEEPPLSEPLPDLAPNELYELLVDLKIRGFELLTAGEDVLTVRPASALAPEEIALLKKHKTVAIAWIAGIEDHRRPRLEIKAALEEWFAADEGARVWALTLPRRGEKYVAAQLWQAVGELADRGVSEVNREVLAAVLMEVVGELKREEAA